jgi:hypothetical protein
MPGQEDSGRQEASKPSDMTNSRLRAITRAEATAMISRACTNRVAAREGVCTLGEFDLIIDRANNAMYQSEVIVMRIDLGDDSI